MSRETFSPTWACIIFILFYLKYSLCFAGEYTCSGKNCLNCCLDKYQMCIAVQDTTFAVSPIHHLKEYLENNLIDTEFLGIKIIGKPNILLRKNLGLYYVETNQNKKLFLLRTVCAKIAGQCKLKCKN